MSALVIPGLVRVDATSPYGTPPYILPPSSASFSITLSLQGPKPSWILESTPEIEQSLPAPLSTALDAFIAHSQALALLRKNLSKEDANLAITMLSSPALPTLLATARPASESSMTIYMNENLSNLAVPVPLLMLELVHAFTASVTMAQPVCPDQTSTFIASADAVVSLVKDSSDNELSAILSAPLPAPLDPFSTLSLFSSALNADTLHARPRAVAWLASTTLIRPTVSLNDSVSALASSDTPDRIAANLLATVDGPSGWSKTISADNAEAVPALMAEYGRSVVVSRFGRASYFLALLAASSQSLDRAMTSAALQGPIEALRSLPLEPGLNPDSPTAPRLMAELSNIRDYLSGLSRDFTTLINSKSQQLTRAALSGVIERIGVDMTRVQRAWSTKVDDWSRTAIASDNPTEAMDTILDAQRTFLNLLAALHKATAAFRSALASVPGSPTTLAVLLQRPSSTGIRALQMLRLGRDPFEGGEELIAAALASGGASVLGSRDPSWLANANYWIEALPLFIHEEPSDHAAASPTSSNVVIEQDGMELALRAMAPHWAANISTVAITEAAALARLFFLTSHAASHSTSGPLGALWRSVASQLTSLDAADAAATLVLRYWFTGSEQLPTNHVLSSLLSLLGLLPDSPAATAISTTLEGLAPIPTPARPALLRALAATAALVNGSWRRLRWPISRSSLSRWEALVGALAPQVAPFFTFDIPKASASEGNALADLESALASPSPDPYAGVVAAVVASFTSWINSTGWSWTVTGATENILAKNLALAPRRPLPTWIMLTTQAPGMSDAFAAHWVDEEMVTAALTRGWKDPSDPSKTLEDEARSLASTTHERIAAIAVGVVVQFSMDHLLPPGPAAARRSAAVKLLRSYNDLAEEVAAAFMLWELLPDPVTDLEQLSQHPDPPAVLEALDQYRESIESSAAIQVMTDNAELTEPPTVDHPIYGPETAKVSLSLARRSVIDTLPSSTKALVRWYALAPSADRGPRALRARLMSAKGMTTARQQVLATYALHGLTNTITKVLPGQGLPTGTIPLAAAANDPLWAATGRGPAKAYHRGYGPSRVDLGKRERVTTEVYTQWIGPADAGAKASMTAFYRRFNYDVRAWDDLATGEEMKPLENALMEASLGVTHVFVPLFQAIGTGSLLKLIYECNQRPEVFVRSGGGGSAGFCQPKDIYYLPFVNTIFFQEAADYAGLPANATDAVFTLLTRLAEKHALPADTGASEPLAVLLDELINMYNEEGLSEGSFLLNTSGAGIPAGVSSGSLSAIAKMGRGHPLIDSRKFASSLVAEWHANVLSILEERLRFAPVHLIHLLRAGLQSRGVAWQDAVLTLPAEYKPVSDARLSVGLRMFELLAGTGDHILAVFDPDGRALARLLLYGYKRDDMAMNAFLAPRLAPTGLTPDVMDALEKAYPVITKPLASPGDLRLVSPFSLSAEAVQSYVAGTNLAGIAASVGDRLRVATGVDDDTLVANALTVGADLTSWLGLRSNPEVINSLAKDLGGSMHAFVADVRLKDQEYRKGPGSDLWISLKGSDVFATLVHYPAMTGDEDTGVELPELGHVETTMIADLPRVAATMKIGRSSSALVWLDAPTQGRKPAADTLAIKQWLSLGGWYVSPTVAPREVERLGEEAKTDGRLVGALLETLSRGDIDAAEALWARVQNEIAADRYWAAREEEAFVRDASVWWRGGGFNNWSARHRVLARLWGLAASGAALTSVDATALMVLGGCFAFIGRPSHDILALVEAADATLEKSFQQQGDAAVPHSVWKDDSESQWALSAFAPAAWEPVGKAEVALVKGESVSLKRREDDAGAAAGQALANWKARSAAVALNASIQGYKNHKAKAASLVSWIEALPHGDSPDARSWATYGALLAELEVQADALVSAFKSSVGGSEDVYDRFTDNVGRFVNAGEGSEPADWSVIVGKGDSTGDLGALSLRAGGNKDLLKILASFAAGLDAALLLMLTLEAGAALDFGALGPGQSPEAIGGDVLAAVAKFFSSTVYDHTFDYFPVWMHPARAGPGFSDYDTIMGPVLGAGSPLSRTEVLVWAAELHQWHGDYLWGLISTKTRYGRWNESDRAALVGRWGRAGREGRITPVGGAPLDCLPEEADWWTYTQAREIAFLSQQGHTVAALVQNVDKGVCGFGSRPAVGIISPIGRPHLTCFLKEVPTYNRENPDQPICVVLSRSYVFEQVGDETLMRLPNGLMYVSEDEYTQLTGGAIPEDAKTAKGIAVAVSWKSGCGPVNCLSMPFHGAPYYVAGRDEAIGMPTLQAWIHNLLPGYAKTLESRIYAGAEWFYPPEERWWAREQAAAGDKARQVLMARLRKLPWMKVIAKPSKQSGGRGSTPGRLMSAGGELVSDEDLGELADAILVQGAVDDVVLQRMLSSSPYVYASGALVGRMTSGLVKRGVSLPKGADLFAYSRVVTVDRTGSGAEGVYSEQSVDVLLELVVASRGAVSNVGLGGVLVKWQEEYGQSPETSAALSGERRANALGSLPMIERESRKLWEQILARDPALAEEDPKLYAMAERLKTARHGQSGVGVDRLGRSYAAPRYLMHDLIDVPVVMMPARGDIGPEEVVAPDIVDMQFHDDGALATMDVVDARSEPWTVVKVGASAIVGWRSVKIEDNIGFGLWQPYDQDEASLEREAASRDGRPADPDASGGPLRALLSAFAKTAASYLRVVAQTNSEVKGSWARSEVEEATAKQSAVPARTTEPRWRRWSGLAGLRGTVLNAAGSGYDHDQAVLIVFDEWEGALEELGAVSRSQKPGGAVVYGAHAEWVRPRENGRGVEAVSALTVDSDGVGLVHGAPVGALPLVPDAVLILGAASVQWGSDEVDAHRGLTSVASTGDCRVLNGYQDHGLWSALCGTLGAQRAWTSSPAAIADDKGLTAERLRYRVPTPETVKVDSKALHEGGAGQEAIRRWISSIQGLSGDSVYSVRIQPAKGTGGVGHIVVERADFEGIVVAASKVAAWYSAEEVIVREEVGNLRAEGDRRATLRVVVGGAWPGEATVLGSWWTLGARGHTGGSAEEGAGVVDWASGQVMTGLVLKEGDQEVIHATAVKAVSCLNDSAPPGQALALAGVDLELEVDEQGTFVKAWVLEVNARPAGLAHLPGVYGPVISAGLVSVRDAGVVARGLVDCAVNGLDGVSHMAVLSEAVRMPWEEWSESDLASVGEQESLLLKVMSELTVFLNRKGDDVVDGVRAERLTPNLRLLQQRALVMLGDTMWVYGHFPGAQRLLGGGHGPSAVIDAAIVAGARVGAGRVTAADLRRSLSEESRARALVPWTSAANALELADYEASLKVMSERTGSWGAQGSRLASEVADGVSVAESTSGLRMSFSSANASDNWTTAKLRGGVVLNAAFQLLSGHVSHDKPSTVSARLWVEPGSEKGIELKALGQSRKWIVGEGDGKSLVENLHDVSDLLRMLRAALVFVGLVKVDEEDPVAGLVSRSGDVGLIVLETRNSGPSGSGLASSSAVALNLLNVLLRASGRGSLLDKDPSLLGSAVLLLENRLRLKSGRQDVDGPILPGVKALEYAPTTGVLLPKTPVREVSVSPEFWSRIAVVSSGIARPAATDHTRGLNMRHLAWLSRDGPAYGALEASYGIHEAIVDAVESEKVAAVGILFRRYMGLRTTMDPGATASIFDAVAGRRVLLDLFDPLAYEGLIYGGMFTGAMGGGVALLALTDKGEEKIDDALEKLKELKVGERRPFHQLSRMSWNVDQAGVQFALRPSDG